MIVAPVSAPFTPQLVHVLHLAAGANAVADGRPALARFIAEAALAPPAANRLDVVFEELISNIVRHAGLPADAVIVVQMRADAGAVELEITDPGRSFDPLALARPAPLQRLDDAPEGGLGIELVRRLTRSFSHQPGDDGRGNRVRAVIDR